MTSRKLNRLDPHARSLITSENYSDIRPEDLQDYISEFEREILIKPLTEMLQEVRSRFPNGRTARAKSDAWLAPRVHASVRLYRQEAADSQLWEYLSLAVPEVRTYILWRWSREDGLIRDLNRLYGMQRRHALGRLWWVAELCRNGPDYSPAVDAFNASQDMINYITDTDAFQNR